MPPGIGYSFAPTGQEQQLPPRGQGGQGSAPQQAIRTLSLRVPQTQSVPGIAPLPLLNAQGGGGSDLSMLLMALMRAFGGGGGMGQQGFGGGGTPPRIRPIDETSGPGGPSPLPPPTGTIPRDFPPRNPNARPEALPGGIPPRDFPPTDGVPQPLPPPSIPRDFPPAGGPLEQTGVSRGFKNRGAFHGVEPLF